MGSIGIASAPSTRLRLLALGSLGRKSAGAAAITSTSVRGQLAPDRRFQLAGALDPAERRRPPEAPSATGPEMSTTSAPRSQATSATRYPILPLERLVTTRTGSIDSRVGPAVTTIRRPASFPLSAKHPRRVRQDRLRLAHSARPLGGPLGERADLRTDDRDASRPQPLQVGLGLGSRVHLVVHRRGDEDRCGAGEQQRGEEIVGQPLRHAGDQVRGGRAPR